MDFIRCPQCHSQNWFDRAAMGDKDQGMRFQCTRCSKIIRLTGCSHCKAQNWLRENDLYQKGSRKPIVRYRCQGCGRIIGLYLDHDILR